MITYQEELIKDILPEFTELLEPHMAEINVLYKSGEKLNPDFNRYFKMQEAGVYLFMTCRNNGKLVGYIGFFLVPNIRFKDCVVASEDLYYLKPENRQGRTGYKLFTESEKLLKQRGIRHVILSCKVFQDHSRLFNHLGYRFYEKLFTKSL